MTMISSSMMPMGMLVFGPLADIMAIEWLLIGTGLAMIVLSALLVKNKPLLEAGAVQSKDKAS
jgi:DHA3 family macrolide efflux protein-like MFS transporter